MNNIDKFAFLLDRVCADSADSRLQSGVGVIFGLGSFSGSGSNFGILETLKQVDAENVPISQ